MSTKNSLSGGVSGSEVVLLVLGILVTVIVTLGNIYSGQDQSSKGASATKHSVSTTTTKEVDEYKSIPFKKKTVNDSSMTKGQIAIRVVGVNGSQKYTYKVTYKGKKRIARQLTKKEVITQPIDEITALGTKIVWSCIDVTSYDYNWGNDMLCTSSNGESRYTSYSGAQYLESL